METYTFTDYSLLARACRAVLATLPDAPIDHDSAGRIVAAIAYSEGTNSIQMKQFDAFMFQGCFEVSCETDPEWSEDDYREVVATLKP